MATRDDIIDEKALVEAFVEIASQLDIDRLLMLDSKERARIFAQFMARAYGPALKELEKH